MSRAASCRNADLRVVTLPRVSSSTGTSCAIATTRVYATARSPYGRPADGLVAARNVVRLQRVGVLLVEQVVAPTDVTLPVRRGERLGEVRVYQRGGSWRGCR